LRTAETSGDFEAIFLALASIGALHEQRGEPHAARQFLLRTLDTLKQLGDTMRTSTARFRLGANAFALGEWEEARRWYLEAVVIEAQGERPELQLAQRGLLCLDLIEGRRPLTEMPAQMDVVIARQHTDIGFTLYTTNALVEITIIAGFSGAVRDGIKSAIDNLGFNDFLRCEWLTLLAWAEWELGDEEVARGHLAEARQRADMHRSRLAYVTIRHVEAIIAVAERRWDDAIQALESELALTHETPYPYAKALYIYGQLHRERGEPESTHQYFAQALAILHRLGERLYAERIEHELAQEE